MQFAIGVSRTLSVPAFLLLDPRLAPITPLEDITMSNFSLEFLNPFSGGGGDLFDFDPVGLLKEGSQFRPPGLPRIEPSSLNFTSPFENLLSFDVPSPREILGINFGDGGLSGTFGASFDTFSNLFSRPGKLAELGLFGGHEGIGGIVGNLFDSAKNAFGLGDIGSWGGKISGILGGAMDFLGPAGGILGGLFGHQDGVKGLLSSVMSGMSFGGPIGAGIMGLAHITGLDKLAGKALGGIGKAIGGVGKAIGSGFKKLGGLFGL